MNQAVGEAPEWAGLGLGPELMEGVWLGSFMNSKEGRKERGIQEWTQLG